ncbi:MAG: ribosome-associated translation inhibitor RaiA [Phycisphaerae bacterium]|nr:ribosome-associated translation inhibitor RaiA [Phycisphaerae bacterium]MDP7637971.1 ribosome-associated translation inhibitor RaiA [Phycisphaerae bacterium]
MNIVVEARHMEVTDAMRQYVQTKAAKLPRYYGNVQSIEVILDMEADRPMAEIVVQASRKATFVAIAHNEDMYTCIDQCLHKITGQLRRHKDRVRDRQGMPHGTTDGLANQ